MLNLTNTFRPPHRQPSIEFAERVRCALRKLDRIKEFQAPPPGNRPWQATAGNGNLWPESQPMQNRPDYPAGSMRRLSGAALAQIARRKTAVERAILGAELVEGSVQLEPPTAKAAGTLVNVSYGYIRAALKLSPEQRAAVLAGERPLIEERHRSAPIEPVYFDKIVADVIRSIGIDRALAAVIQVEAETSSVTSPSS